MEDLWPFIEADPELGRDALMTRPLEAMEYKGGLYRIGAYFGIDTLIGRRDVVGDRLTWTYDDLWAVYDTMPHGQCHHPYRRLQTRYAGEIGGEWRGALRRLGKRRQFL